VHETSVRSGVSEDRYVREAARGDLAAFNRLVLAYQDQAYNLAYRVLGNTDDAADATQEAFLSCFRAMGSFRGGSFRAWLLRVTLNSCYDLLRRRKRNSGRSLEQLAEADESRTDVPDPDPGPEKVALGSETWHRVQAGLMLLPEEQRVAVVLSDIYELTYEEVVEVTGWALGTVKSRLSRGRARLRDYLVAHGELP